MANWSALRDRLRAVGDVARFTWSELDAIVGGLPPSASKHRAWWSGDRPHVRAWRSAGFTISHLVMGREITFVRTHIAQVDSPVVDATEPDRPAVALPVAAAAKGRAVDLVLVTCVKTKLTTPAAAKDLYVSSLFRRQRDYAERVGVPWFILSAEHGLVAPDEWLAPYERYLPETPAAYRSAWGAWVTERLDMLAGPLQGTVVEVHASGVYIDTIRPHLTAKDAIVLEPLAGLTIGQRLGWYDTQGSSAPVRSEATGEETQIDASAFVAMLLDESQAIPPTQFVDRGRAGVLGPGLYSWWVDEAGAADLARGLGLPMSSGLIYAGLAGATRWPSGRRSQNTLWSRINGMHLGGRHGFSTFRRTLGSILAKADRRPTIDETALTKWMKAHLKVRSVPYNDPDTLGRLEGDVLAEINPPLNIMGMADSPVRRRLKELRRPHR